ncbi:MAG: hypothetical protein MJZ68_01510 [archaeon]|nr:hypothetical protein [archaeon]
MSGQDYSREIAKVVGYLFDFQEQNAIDSQLFLDALIDTLAQLFCEEFLGFPEDVDSLLEDIVAEIADICDDEPEQADLHISIFSSGGKCDKCSRKICREDCTEHDSDITDREMDSGFDTLEDK